MTVWTLLRRGLWHYRRTNLGVLLGAAAASAVLVGALLVGDSVRQSLRTIAHSRLGRASLTLRTGDRPFRDVLAAELGNALGAEAAAVIQLPGTATQSDSGLRANQVQVLGVDDAFWRLSPAGQPPLFPRDDQALVSASLARQLHLNPGDRVILRLHKPSALPRDAVLAPTEDQALALTLTVTGTTDDNHFGRFSLQANQLPPLNVFVPRAWLAQKADWAGKGNLLLLGDSARVITVEAAQAALARVWRLADADLELRAMPEQDVIELRTRRVFLDDAVTAAARRASPQAQEVLTYFANELRVGSHATPYSMVSAVRPSPAGRGWSAAGGPGEGTPNWVHAPIEEASAASSAPSPGGTSAATLSQGERVEEPPPIVINQWLADDLSAHVGDTLEIKYYILSDSRRLEERTHTFRVRDVVLMRPPWTDRTLMPEFPGLANQENCRDWKPGFAIDVTRIRDKDEDYWDQFRGTPKAFIDLATGQQLWANRFGNLTAVRYPLAGNRIEEIERAILGRLEPASVGLSFVDVRAQAEAAAGQSLDFGQLFLGLSLFLIVAALVLTGLLFSFNLQQRRPEIGTLLALGYRAATVRWLLLAEGAVLAGAGTILGTAGGMLYTWLVLLGLSTVWRGAVGGSMLRFHARPATLLIGAGAGLVVALGTIWLGVRRQAKLPARVLLAGEGAGDLLGATDKRSLFRGGSLSVSWATWKTLTRPQRWPCQWHAYGLIVLTIVTAGWLVARGSADPRQVAGAFFGAGALLLAAGLAGCWVLMERLDKPNGAASGGGAKRVRVGLIGLRGASRRRGRSLATVGVLASGVFLVVAVGATRQDFRRDASSRDSGTGGFALYGESTLPVLNDLNTQSGREALGLSEEALAGVAVVNLRVRAGDDASCLNLNRAQMPKLLGVNPQELARRKAFGAIRCETEGPRSKTASGNARPGEDGWLVLDTKLADGVVPAVGDETTVAWGLGKSLGDTLTYRDERGREFKVRIVGIIGNSILQGSLLISERHFLERYPSESGYRALLIDMPRKSFESLVWIEPLREALSRALGDLGLELTPAAERLAMFGTVEETYRAIFAALGGLGLILGSLGLGVVVLRNVLERRGELALLRAVGFSRRQLTWLVLSEHGLLLGLGWTCGVVAAVLAVWPTIPGVRAAGSGFPTSNLLVMPAVILGSGVLWIWLAARAALRGGLIEALREE